MPGTIISMRPYADRMGFARKLESLARSSSYGALVQSEQTAPAPPSSVVPFVAKPRKLFDPLTKQRRATRLQAEQDRVNGDTKILAAIKRLNRELDTCVWPIDEIAFGGAELAECIHLSHETGIAFVKAGWIYHPEYDEERARGVYWNAKHYLWNDTGNLVRQLRDALNAYPLSAWHLSDRIAQVRERWLRLFARRIGANPFLSLSSGA